MKIEHQRGGVYDVSTYIISTITSHKPGYIDRDLETIVGIQTDEPLKRSIIPFGGYRMVSNSLNAYGKKRRPNVQMYLNIAKLIMMAFLMLIPMK